MRFEMYPTIITPFTESGTIDYLSLDRLIERFAEIGCDGVFAVCQSSEMFFLSEEEKLRLAEFSIAGCRKYGIKCVVSGHTQGDIDAQIEYLRRLEKLGCDAIILVSNRLAAETESEDIALKNLKTILDALKGDTKLGIYECPYPYKRALSDELICAMLADGRFRFIKDTCCQSAALKHRLEMIQGSEISLFNANMATLEESLDDGAKGYSGVMLNIMPEFFGLLKQALTNGETYRARKIFEYLSFASTIEYQNYPANAKLLLKRAGLIETTLCRNGKPPLNESQTKEIEAFERVNRDVFFSMMQRAPYRLVCDYNSFFRECHASSVLPLKDNRVLIAYFAGTREGADDVGIWLSVCENGEFLPPRQIAKLTDEAHWNPVLYECGEGIRLTFRMGRTISAWQTYTCLSTDGGASWSYPEKYPDTNPAGGPVRNKPISLNGCMLAPNSDESRDGWSPRIDISRDGGRFFERFGEIPINRENPAEPTYMKGLGAIQPTLWIGDDNQIHALLRTCEGKIFVSDSNDNGKTWSCARPTDLPNNNSAIDVVKHRGALYLVMNPVGENRGRRNPLVLMRSRDDGAHFEYLRAIATDLIDDTHNAPGQFSYPSIAAINDKLYISFTHNRKSIALCEVTAEE